MIIKTPKFWFNNRNEINPILYTLKPLSKIWEVVTKLRLVNGLWEKMPIPVICVGNLTVGGSGKTPVTMSLQKLLAEIGIKACIVSRGYGGKIQRPHYVTKNDTYDKVGDEPLIISKKGAIIKYFDPTGYKNEFSKLKNVTNKTSIKDAVQNSDLVILHTEWNDFKSINFKNLVKGKKFVIFDMRNLYSSSKIKQQGFKYYSVGK